MNKKQYSHPKASSRKWQQIQARAKAHAEKTGIPFHLWLLHSQQVIRLPSPAPKEEPPDLHQSFREELLS